VPLRDQGNRGGPIAAPGGRHTPELLPVSCRTSGAEVSPVRLLAMAHRYGPAHWSRRLAISTRIIPFSISTATATRDRVICRTDARPRVDHVSSPKAPPLLRAPRKHARQLRPRPRVRRRIGRQRDELRIVQIRQLQALSQRAPDQRQLRQRARAARPHLEATGERPAPQLPNLDQIQ
jgi:hypothetical protein